MKFDELALLVIFTALALWMITHSLLGAFLGGVAVAAIIILVAEFITKYFD